jgi:hypothetical protein
VLGVVAYCLGDVGVLTSHNGNSKDTTLSFYEGKKLHLIFFTSSPIIVFGLKNIQKMTKRLFLAILAAGICGAMLMQAVKIWTLPRAPFNALFGIFIFQLFYFQLFYNLVWLLIAKHNTPLNKHRNDNKINDT